ncbi:E3 ubiquitin-protein ligase PPP1R11-like [Rhopilema esculentum]|uniref:E3 ubiquitin-protein ligase PPP1R11-like n=1 Tax=Rhopilema esculentum TaxID=499914 RepID=UPI0031D39D29|eukprot:gene16215-7588_t
MASAAVVGSSGSETQTIEPPLSQEQALVLHLQKPKNDKKVQWKQGTVDNENAGKKSSKCCCIYERPKVFGESSSESEESDNEDKCKGPKDYHKKSKSYGHNHEDCNCG